MTSIPVPSPGFATIDFETTGFHAEGTDRAIEISVVHSEPDGTITGHGCANRSSWARATARACSGLPLL